MSGKQADLAQETARATADWLSDGVFYQMFLRAFTPEGTLRAATAKLPEVAALGANIVYLCPICLQDDDPRPEFWSKRQVASGFNNPCNPYRIKDFYAVDPEYGTDEDLRQFTGRAHELGLKVILDIVFFHCGPKAVFLAEHPDYVKRDAAGVPVTGQWNFPQLNYESAGLREHLWQNLEYWIREFGVDGYRCDVSDAVPLDFWEEGRKRMERLKPDVIMLAEGERPADQLYAFDIDYCFTLTGVVCDVYDGKKPASAVRETWERMRAERPAGSRFIRYIDNHDLANDCGTQRREEQWSPAGVSAALALVFGLDGTPFIYNGQEAADDARHSIYAQLPVNWARGAQPEGRFRRKFLTELVALRRGERALCRGDLTWLETDQPGTVLAFARRQGRDSVLVAANLSGKPVRAGVTVKAAGATELFAAGAKVKTGAQAGQLALELDAFGYFIGRLK